MNKKSLVLTMLSAATLLGFASASYGQSVKSQSSGLMSLANEVATLRAMVEDLQDQIGGSADPYSGTFAVTLVETAYFGCAAGPLVPLPPNPLPPYLISQATSSISTRSAVFDVEADGSVLFVPEFELLTQELRLSGFYQTDLRTEGPFELAIGADGSLYADFGDAEVRGQIANDGSMFSALVQGHSIGDGGCKDVWTVDLTGVKK